MPPQETPTPEQQPVTYQASELFTPDYPAGPPPRKSIFSKKMLIIIIIAVVLIGGGIVGYLKFSNKKVPSTSKTSTAKTSAPKSTKSGIDSIIYYHQAKYEDPLTIYSKPVTSGTRQKLLTLKQKVSDQYYWINNSAVSGQNVIYDTYDGIYASQDGGKTFKNVFKLTPTVDEEDTDPTITSLGFSEDGKKIVFALLPGFGEGNVDNTVKTIELDGNNQSDIHTFKDIAGVFVYNYDSENQQLIYSMGCYYCDGGGGSQHLMDLKTGNDKELFSIKDNQILDGVSVSPDGKNLIYAVGVSDEELVEQAGGVGWQGGPPYKIMQVDVATGKSTQLATIGTLHEKASDGSFKIFVIQIGYTIDTHQPYYIADNKLFIIDGTKSNLIHEAAKNILYHVYISSKEIIIGVDSSVDDNTIGNHTFYHYDTATKKTHTIYENKSGENTVPMGVTTN